MPSPHRPRAFTLIELLVVVAIIAMLIGILLPSLTKARATARSLQCLSNLRNVGTASEMYADEQKNWYPPLWAHGPQEYYSWNRNNAFRKMLNLDLSSSAEEPIGLFCPDSPKIERDQNNFGNQYGMNNVGTVFGVRKTHGGTLDAVSAHRGKLVSPALLVSTCDATDRSAPAVEDAVNGVRFDRYGDKAPQRGGSHTAAFRHLNQEGLNAMHYDGHAEYYTRKDAYPDSEGWKRIWNLGISPRT